MRHFDNRGSQSTIFPSALKIGMGLVLILSLFVIGEYLQRLIAYQQGWGSKTPIKAASDLALNVFHRLPHPVDDAKLENCGLPVYQLRILTKHLRELRKTADRVSAARYSTGIPREYVPAQFLMDDRWIDIDVKLRGLTASHYSTQRPSLRLKFPKSRLFHGKRQTNILRATDKGITKDLTTNWELSRHGIVTWDSNFVVLKINDEVIGLFQEIEQFGRFILDRVGRTEGFIFGGTGQLFGDEGGFAWGKAQGAMNWFTSCKEQFDASPESGPCNWELIEQYVDADKFAWAAAQSTLVGSHHAWADDNVRLYYDPARGRLEPIPWDYLAYELDPESSPNGETCNWQCKAFLRIPQFRQMRDKRLWTLLTERIDPMINHANELFDRLKEPFGYDYRTPNPWREQDIHDAFVATLRVNSDYLKELFHANSLHANAYRSAAGRFAIEFENRGKAFVSVRELILQQGKEQVRIPLSHNHLVDGKWSGEPGRSRLDLEQQALGRLTSFEGLTLVGVTARNEITGATLVDKEVTIRAGDPPFLASQPKSNLPERDVVDLPPHVRRVEKQILFGPEPVHLSSTWEVSRDYTVRFLPGLRLSLADGASLILHGDLTSIGTKDEPIIVQGATSKQGWGGLVVQGTRTQPSSVHLEHTRIIGGSGAENARCHFLGAFSVTDGVVRLQECQFVEGDAIDGINLKYCKVDLRGNLFSRFSDDAVDLDFCQGTVVGNKISESGGDGFDLSGSEVLVEHNVIENCLDKGISVGERTRAEIKNNIILDCRTGIASKDGSHALIEATGMARLEVGIALYRKKLTFGPPSAQVQGVVMVDVATAFLEQSGSTLKMSESARYVVGNVPTSKKNGMTILTIAHDPKERKLKTLLVANENQSASWGVLHANQLPW